MAFSDGARLTQPAWAELGAEDIGHHRRQELEFGGTLH